MQVDVCIQTRRSVRKYSDQDISGDTLREIVDLARFSPSWKNTQVVRYHVVKNADLKEKIAQNCVLGFDFNAKTIVRCNALVIVSVVTKVSGYEPDGSYSTTQEDRWEMFDAGIANQTFCLAAHSKGVGSVILGVLSLRARRSPTATGSRASAGSTRNTSARRTTCRAKSPKTRAGTPIISSPSCWDSSDSSTS